jgi:hypothetical protein
LTQQTGVGPSEIRSVRTEILSRKSLGRG